MSLMNMHQFVVDYPQLVHKDTAFFKNFFDLLDGNEYTQPYFEDECFAVVKCGDSLVGFQHNGSEWVVPFGPYTCHTHWRVDPALLVAHMPSILEQLRKHDIEESVIATETFDVSFPRHMESVKQNFLWVNSPLSVTHASYEELFASLPKKKRDRLKTAIKHYPLTPVEECPGNLIEWLSYRWEEGDEDGEDLIGFALVQYFWALADPRTQWVYSKDAVAYFEHGFSVDQPLIFQGIARRPDSYNVGPQLLALSNITLNGRGFKVFDPTCKVMLQENDSDIYKRSVINKDNMRPMMYATREPFDGVGELPLFAKDKWYV